MTALPRNIPALEYEKAAYSPEDVIYPGSDEDEQLPDDCRERRQRLVLAAGNRYLSGLGQSLTTARLAGPFEGWKNPWKSKEQASPGLVDHGTQTLSSDRRVAENGTPVERSRLKRTCESQTSLPASADISHQLHKKKRRRTENAKVTGRHGQEPRVAPGWSAPPITNRAMDQAQLLQSNHSGSHKHSCKRPREDPSGEVPSDISNRRALTPVSEDESDEGETHILHDLEDKAVDSHEKCKRLASPTLSEDATRRDREPTIYISSGSSSLSSDDEDEGGDYATRIELAAQGKDNDPMHSFRRKSTLVRQRADVVPTKSNVSQRVPTQNTPSHSSGASLLKRNMSKSSGKSSLEAQRRESPPLHLSRASSNMSAELQTYNPSLINRSAGEEATPELGTQADRNRASPELLGSLHVDLQSGLGEVPTGKGRRREGTPAGIAGTDQRLDSDSTSNHTPSQAALAPHDSGKADHNSSRRQEGMTRSGSGATKESLRGRAAFNPETPEPTSPQKAPQTSETASYRTPVSTFTFSGKEIQYFAGSSPRKHSTADAGRRIDRDTPASRTSLSALASMRLLADGDLIESIDDHDGQQPRRSFIAPIDISLTEPDDQSPQKEIEQAPRLPITPKSHRTSPQAEQGKVKPAAAYTDKPRRQVLDSPVRLQKYPASQPLPRVLERDTSAGAEVARRQGSLPAFYRDGHFTTETAIALADDILNSHEINDENNLSPQSQRLAPAVESLESTTTKAVDNVTQKFPRQTRKARRNARVVS